MDSSFPGEWIPLVLFAVFLPSPCINKEILKKEYGIRSRDRCKYPLFAEMPNSQKNGSDHQACCTVHFTSVALAMVLSFMHDPLWELIFLFWGEGGGWSESSMYFPRNTGVLQDYMFFSLEGSWNKMVFMGSWGNFGCFYQMDIKPLMAYLPSGKFTYH